VTRQDACGRAQPRAANLRTSLSEAESPRKALEIDAARLTEEREAAENERHGRRAFATRARLSPTPSSASDRKAIEQVSAMTTILPQNRTRDLAPPDPDRGSLHRMRPQRQRGRGGSDPLVILLVRRRGGAMHILSRVRAPPIRTGGL
jgi:hypothetical protein